MIGFDHRKMIEKAIVRKDDRFFLYIIIRKDRKKGGKNETQSKEPADRSVGPDHRLLSLGHGKFSRAIVTSKLTKSYTNLTIFFFTINQLYELYKN